MPVSSVLQVFQSVPGGTTGQAGEPHLPPALSDMRGAGDGMSHVRQPVPGRTKGDAGGTAEDGWGASLHDFPLRHWESMRSLGISWDAKMGCCIADLWLRMVKL